MVEEQDEEEVMGEEVFGRSKLRTATAGDILMSLSDVS